MHTLGKAAASLLSIVAVGCVSQIPRLDKWAQSLVGEDVQVLRDLAIPPESYSARIGWKEKTYPLGNGNWVYVQPDRPDCQIHFEVDPAGIIVGYTPVGAGCRNQ